MALLFTEGFDNDGLISTLTAQIGAPYPIAAASGSLPLVASQLLLGHCFVADVLFAADFAGSSGSVQTAATALCVITIDQCLAADDPTLDASWINIGTINVTGTNVSFVSNGDSSDPFARGDFMRWVAPASPDATLAALSVILLGSQV
jgi:hypothetical protein